MILTPVVDIREPYRIIKTLETRVQTTSLVRFLAGPVSAAMADVIVDRFAWAGDRTVGRWEPLSAYTERLKAAMGAPDNAPNERSGDMMYHLAYEHATIPIPDGAMLQIPGNSDDLMKKKIKVAQYGQPANENPLGGSTPPRPVLGIGEAEEHIVARMTMAYIWARV